MRAIRAVLAVLGLAAASYGAYGILTGLSARALRGWLRFWLGSALAHDLVLAPLVVLAGWALARLVPPVARGPVQAGALVTGVLVLVEAPFITGAGRRPDVPSALPLNYGLGTLLVVAGVWAAVAVVVGYRLHRRARRPGSATRAATPDRPARRRRC